MKQQDLSTFLEKGLQYAFLAENQILEGLRWMEQVAKSSSLKKLFKKHLQETTGQIDRIKNICSALDITCEPQHDESKLHKALDKGKEILKDIAHWGSSSRMSIVQSLLEEGKETAERLKEADPQIQDMALCGGAMQIEMAEIGGYNLLSRFASMINEEDVVKLLKETLDEEKKMFSFLKDVYERELVQEEGQEAMAASGENK